MKFISRKHSALRLVVDPRYSRREMGRTTTESLTGDTPRGLTVEFRDHLFETDDKSVIKALKNHDSYGLDFFSDEPGEKAEPTVEAVRAENEKSEVAEAVRSKCPICGNDFKTDFALSGHMKTHDEPK